MEHSIKFNKVKKYFNSNLWDITMVRNAVVHNWITESEFEEITSEKY